MFYPNAEDASERDSSLDSQPSSGSAGNTTAVSLDPSMLEQLRTALERERSEFFFCWSSYERYVEILNTLWNRNLQSSFKLCLLKYESSG